MTDRVEDIFNMQTFMPYPDYIDSSECLDYRRLGKQRVETKQILDVLEGRTNSWSNHPIVKAWRGYEESLALYGLYICSEWRMRGYKDSLFPWFQIKRIELRRKSGIPPQNTPQPAWIRLPEVNRAYQELLVWKEPEFYEEVFDMVVLKEPPFPWELLT